MTGVPKLDPFYVFETDRLRDLTTFWVGGFKAMLIEGDPAAGKSSLITQWHSRLNVPLDVVPCSPTTENFRLIGQLLPGLDGRLHWQDGPVTRACRLGTSVLLDEYNTLDPGEATALNLLLEGYSWTIPETGEIIEPAPSTRFFATQNSVDSAAAVAGRNVQDVANEDRFVYMEVDYLRAELEEDLVLRHLLSGGVDASHAKNIAYLTVTVANQVRTAFRDGADAIEKPLSTRAVLRWAKLTAMYNGLQRQKKISAIHYALKRAVKMPLAMQAAVKNLITAQSGVDEDLSTANQGPV
jgi:cobaltochelatase CobS